MRLAPLIAILTAIFLPQLAAGQSFRGAVESNSAVYFDDPALGPAAHRWGSNNCLKLDWQRDSLSAGVQA
ncbi:MAG: hypothetical protein II424_03925, partial [Bacteroidales bacterium]|nr:hypothetical protein [Bacteroidales bacterium]